MIAQVVTTARLIGTGPSWNRTSAASGLMSIISAPSGPAPRRGRAAGSRRSRAAAAAPPAARAAQNAATATARRRTWNSQAARRPPGPAAPHGAVQQPEIGQARRRARRRARPVPAAGGIGRGAHSFLILCQARQHAEHGTGEDQRRREVCRCRKPCPASARRRRPPASARRSASRARRSSTGSATAAARPPAPASRRSARRRTACAHLLRPS